MNIFDILVVAIISFCLIRGTFNGVIGELSGIVGVFAAFYGAYIYYPMIAVHGEPWIENSEIRNLIAFSLLFCAVLIVIGVVSIIIRKIIKFVFLGWVDRFLGLVFGTAKGILFASVLFIIVTTFLPKNIDILSGSYFAPYVGKVSKVMTVFVSHNAKNDLFKKLEGLKTWKL
jgi:membrane protein required for colicin V production